MIEFVAARCECGGMVLDSIAFRGLVRARCRKCRLRVWVQGDGKSLRVIRIDKPRKRLSAEDVPGGRLKSVAVEEDLRKETVAL